MHHQQHPSQHNVGGIMKTSFLDELNDIPPPQLPMAASSHQPPQGSLLNNYGVPLTPRNDYEMNVNSQQIPSVPRDNYYMHQTYAGPSNEYNVQQTPYNRHSPGVGYGTPGYGNMVQQNRFPVQNKFYNYAPQAQHPSHANQPNVVPSYHHHDSQGNRYYYGQNQELPKPYITYNQPTYPTNQSIQQQNQQSYNYIHQTPSVNYQAPPPASKQYPNNVGYYPTISQQNVTLSNSYQNPIHMPQYQRQPTYAAYHSPATIPTNPTFNSSSEYPTNNSYNVTQRGAVPPNSYRYALPKSEPYNVQLGESNFSQNNNIYYSNKPQSSSHLKPTVQSNLNYAGQNMYHTPPVAQQHVNISFAMASSSSFKNEVPTQQHYLKDANSFVANTSNLQTYGPLLTNNNISMPPQQPLKLPVPPPTPLGPQNQEGQYVTSKKIPSFLESLNDPNIMFDDDMIATMSQATPTKMSKTGELISNSSSLNANMCSTKVTSNFSNSNVINPPLMLHHSQTIDIKYPTTLVVSGTMATHSNISLQNVKSSRPKNVTTNSTTSAQNFQVLLPQESASSCANKNFSQPIISEITEIASLQTISSLNLVPACTPPSGTITSPAIFSQTDLVIQSNSTVAVPSTNQISVTVPFSHSSNQPPASSPSSLPCQQTNANINVNISKTEQPNVTSKINYSPCPGRTTYRGNGNNNDMNAVHNLTQYVCGVVNNPLPTLTVAGISPTTNHKFSALLTSPSYSSLSSHQQHLLGLLPQQHQVFKSIPNNNNMNQSQSLYFNNYNNNSNFNTNSNQRIIYPPNHSLSPSSSSSIYNTYNAAIQIATPLNPSLLITGSGNNNKVAVNINNINNPNFSLLTNNQTIMYPTTFGGSIRNNNNNMHSTNLLLGPGGQFNNPSYNHNNINIGTNFAITNNYGFSANFQQNPTAASNGQAFLSLNLNHSANTAIAYPPIMSSSSTCTPIRPAVSIDIATGIDIPFLNIDGSNGGKKRKRPSQDGTPKERKPRGPNKKSKKPQGTTGDDLIPLEVEGLASTPASTKSRRKISNNGNNKEGGGKGRPRPSGSSSSKGKIMIKRNQQDLPNLTHFSESIGAASITQQDGIGRASNSSSTCSIPSMLIVAPGSTTADIDIGALRGGGGSSIITHDTTSNKDGSILALEQEDEEDKEEDKEYSADKQSQGEAATSESESEASNSESGHGRKKHRLIKTPIIVGSGRRKRGRKSGAGSGMVGSRGRNSGSYRIGGSSKRGRRGGGTAATAGSSSRTGNRSKFSGSEQSSLDEEEDDDYRDATVKAPRDWSKFSANRRSKIITQSADDHVISMTDGGGSDLIDRPNPIEGDQEIPLDILENAMEKRRSCRQVKRKTYADNEMDDETFEREIAIAMSNKPVPIKATTSLSTKKGGFKKKIDPEQTAENGTGAEVDQNNLVLDAASESQPTNENQDTKIAVSTSSNGVTTPAGGTKKISKQKLKEEQERLELELMIQRENEDPLEELEKRRELEGYHYRPEMVPVMTEFGRQALALSKRLLAKESRNKGNLPLPPLAVPIVFNEEFLFGLGYEGLTIEKILDTRITTKIIETKSEESTSISLPSPVQTTDLITCDTLISDKTDEKVETVAAVTTNEIQDILTVDIKTEEMEISIADSENPNLGVDNLMKSSQSENLPLEPQDKNSNKIEIEVEEFLVKFKNFSYLHVLWIDEDQCGKLDKRAINKIKRFKQKKIELSEGAMGYLELNDEAFNPDYLELERIIAEDTFDYSFFINYLPANYYIGLNEASNSNDNNGNVDDLITPKTILPDGEEKQEEIEVANNLQILLNTDPDPNLDPMNPDMGVVKIETEELTPALNNDLGTETVDSNTEMIEKCSDPGTPPAIIEKGDSQNSQQGDTTTNEFENLEPIIAKIKASDSDLNVSLSHVLVEPIDDKEITNSKPEEAVETKELIIQDEIHEPTANNTLLQYAAEKHEGKIFLCKWRALNYEDISWEREEDVEQSKISFFRRCQRIPKISNKRIQRPEPHLWRKIPEDIEFKNGNKLREYQLEGVNWLSFCWYNRQNCILADEMGLGKTVQSITFLLEMYKAGVKGPYLILAPLSTIGNWQREFEMWSDLNIVVYHGSSASRQIVQEYEMYYRDNKGYRLADVYKFNALITTYEILMMDCDILKNIWWRVSIIDEAHRLKNIRCKLMEGIKSLKLDHRVLLTGTPLQNNIEELWSLLNFLEPLKFESSQAFLAEYGQLNTEEQVTKLQDLLKPMMLRRLKEDVEKSLAPKEETIIEVELTNIQKKYYRAILEKNFEYLAKGIASSANVPNLMNTMMELRKCCIHPYLIKGAEEKILVEEACNLPPIISNTNTDTPGTSEVAVGFNHHQDNTSIRLLINSSGKLVLIDKLLPKLKSDGHKVLIFSQMTRCLDLLEDYLIHKKYPYERLDGRIRGDLRQAAIDRFCKKDSDRFVFLLCTKAGGLGINLTAADTCVIFDSDWNPQNDLQAQARCHRIGQSKQVKIYRLICRNTYEREMFDRAGKKLGLDKAVLQTMRGHHVSLITADPQSSTNTGTDKDTPSLFNKGVNQLSKKEIEDLLKKGAYGAIMDDDNAGDKFCEEDIEQILSRRTQIVVVANTEGNNVPESEKGGEDSKQNYSSTFAKASFTAAGNRSDIDIDDPNFWQKWAEKADIEIDKSANKKKNMLSKLNLESGLIEDDIDYLDNTWDESTLISGADGIPFQARRSRRRQTARFSNRIAATNRNEGIKDDKNDYLYFKNHEDDEDLKKGGKWKKGKKDKGSKNKSKTDFDDSTTFAGSVDNDNYTVKDTFNLNEDKLSVSSPISSSHQDHTSDTSSDSSEISDDDIEEALGSDTDYRVVNESRLVGRIDDPNSALSARKKKKLKKLAALLSKKGKKLTKRDFKKLKRLQIELNSEKFGKKMRKGRKEELLKNIDAKLMNKKFTSTTTKIALKDDASELGNILPDEFENIKEADKLLYDETTWLNDVKDISDLEGKCWSRILCYRAEKGLITFGWSRWDDILKHEFGVNETPDKESVAATPTSKPKKCPLTTWIMEYLCRLIIIHCLKCYKGDINIKSFIWELVKKPQTEITTAKKDKKVVGSLLELQVKDLPPVNEDATNQSIDNNNKKLEEELDNQTKHNLLKYHTGLSAPVPRGRKGKRLTLNSSGTAAANLNLNSMLDADTGSVNDEMNPTSVTTNNLINPLGSIDEDSETSREEWFGIDTHKVLTDQTYQRHLLRHANKVLLRVRMLYYLRYEIIGDEKSIQILSCNHDNPEEALFLTENSTSPSDPLACVETYLDSLITLPSGIDSEIPAPWWNDKCDKSLLIGTLKHGYENYDRMRCDVKLIFHLICPHPTPPKSRCLEPSQTDPQTTEVSDQEPKVEQPNLVAAVENTEINLPEGDKTLVDPDDHVTLSKVVETTDEPNIDKSIQPNDLITLYNINVWPINTVISSRFRKIVTAYQRAHKKQMIKMEKDNERKEKLLKEQLAFKQNLANQEFLKSLNLPPTTTTTPSSELESISGNAGNFKVTLNSSNNMKISISRNKSSDTSGNQLTPAGAVNDFYMLSSPGMPPPLHSSLLEDEIDTKNSFAKMFLSVQFYGKAVEKLESLYPSSIRPPHSPSLLSTDNNNNNNKFESHYHHQQQQNNQDCIRSRLGCKWTKMEQLEFLSLLIESGVIVNRSVPGNAMEPPTDSNKKTKNGKLLTNPNLPADATTGSETIYDWALYKRFSGYLFSAKPEMYLEEFFVAAYARCVKAIGLNLTRAEEKALKFCPGLSIDPDVASQFLDCIDLLNCVRVELLSHHNLLDNAIATLPKGGASNSQCENEPLKSIKTSLLNSKKLADSSLVLNEDASSHPNIPDWWDNEIYDREMLIGVACHGLGNMNETIFASPAFSFIDILKRNKNVKDKLATLNLNVARLLRETCEKVAKKAPIDSCNKRETREKHPYPFLDAFITDVQKQKATKFEQMPQTSAVIQRLKLICDAVFGRRAWMRRERKCSSSTLPSYLASMGSDHNNINNSNANKPLGTKKSTPYSNKRKIKGNVILPTTNEMIMDIPQFISQIHSSGGTDKANAFSPFFISSLFPDSPFVSPALHSTSASHTKQSSSRHSNKNKKNDGKFEDSSAFGDNLLMHKLLSETGMPNDPKILENFRKAKSSSMSTPNEVSNLMQHHRVPFNASSFFPPFMGASGPGMTDEGEVEDFCPPGLPPFMMKGGIGGLPFPFPPDFNMPYSDLPASFPFPFPPPPPFPFPMPSGMKNTPPDPKKFSKPPSRTSRPSEARGDADSENVVALKEAAAFLEMIIGAATSLKSPSDSPMTMMGSFPPITPKELAAAKIELERIKLKLRKELHRCNPTNTSSSSFMSAQDETSIPPSFFFPFHHTSDLEAMGIKSTNKTPTAKLITPDAAATTSTKHRSSATASRSDPTSPVVAEILAQKRSNTQNDTVPFSTELALDLSKNTRPLSKGTESGSGKDAAMATTSKKKKDIPSFSLPVSPNPQHNHHRIPDHITRMPETCKPYFDIALNKDAPQQTTSSLDAATAIPPFFLPPLPFPPSFMMPPTNNGKMELDFHSSPFIPPPPPGMLPEAWKSMLAAAAAAASYDGAGGGNVDLVQGMFKMLKDAGANNQSGGTDAKTQLQQASSKKQQRLPPTSNYQIGSTNQLEAPQKTAYHESDTPNTKKHGKSKVTTLGSAGKTGHRPSNQTFNTDVKHSQTNASNESFLEGGARLGIPPNLMSPTPSSSGMFPPFPFPSPSFPFSPFGGSGMMDALASSTPSSTKNMHHPPQLPLIPPTNEKDFKDMMMAAMMFAAAQSGPPPPDGNSCASASNNQMPSFHAFMNSFSEGGISSAAEPYPFSPNRPPFFPPNFPRHSSPPPNLSKTTSHSTKSAVKHSMTLGDKVIRQGSLGASTESRQRSSKTSVKPTTSSTPAGSGNGSGAGGNKLENIVNKIKKKTN